jgi:thiol-disulfide isomerase/thioredoxin
MQTVKTPSACQTSRRQVLGLSLAALAASAVPGAARAAYLVRPWPEGKPAPVFELTDLDGRAWNLNALKGRMVMLNFWATWCEPCRAEMPSLELVANRHERAGLVVLAVNYKEGASVIKRFLDQRPFSLPILLDRDGAAAGAWTPRVFPTTVLIDRHGTPRHSVLGDLDWMGPEARELIEPLLLAKPHTA